MIRLIPERVAGRDRDSLVEVGGLDPSWPPPPPLPLVVFKRRKKKKDSPPLGSHGALDFTAQGLCHIGFSSSIVFRCERESSLLKGSENLEKEKRKKEKGKKL